MKQIDFKQAVELEDQKQIDQEEGISGYYFMVDVPQYVKQKNMLSYNFLHDYDLFG